MADWQSIELADSDTLEALGKYGTEAVEKINIALDVVKGGAEIAKLFLMTAVNPVAVAIVIAADEMIAVLGQYKESGVSILIIDPTNPDNGRKQENKLGLEMDKDSNGLTKFEISRPHPQPPPSAISGSYTVNDEYRKSLSLADLKDWRDKNGKEKGHAGFIPPTPKLVFPYKFVQGGYNPETWTGNAGFVAQSSGVNAFGVEIPGIPFPELPADQTIEMMAAAFEDEGDIPKYKIQAAVANKPSQKYYDVDGSEVLFDNPQDKLKELRLELYANNDTKIATSARGLLTTRVATGRPEYTGDTGRTGFQVSALAIVVAAQNPLKFIESLSSLINTLMPDHSELLKSIDAFTDSLTFYEQNLTLTVDSDYGDFQVGDFIIGEKSGCIGQITDISSKEKSVMTTVVVETNQLADSGPHPPVQPPIGIVEKTIDRNLNGRFEDVVLKWEPRGKSHPFGKFNPRETVFEAVEIKTDVGGQDATTYSKKIPAEGWEKRLFAGDNGAGILAKWATVKAQSAVAEASTAPNFSSAKLAQMIPGYGAFFDELINLAEKLKAFAEGVLATIQRLIDVIDKAVEFFEELAESIIALIELLTQGIPNAGIWFMGMNTSTGNAGIASGLRNASNAPDSSYVFSGGLLLVGPVITGGQTKDMNKKLWEMLGIEFQSV
jgi:hypothetical protein